MSQYRLMRHLVAVAALGAFATVGCFVVEDDGDDDDDGGGGEDGAVMKYCNLLYKGDVEAELTLTFAGVEATALSGTCTPVVPRACIPIPAVEGPEVSLVDPSDGTVVVEGAIPTLVVADGEEILVLATVDDVEMAPTVEAGQFLDTYVCSETDPLAEMAEARSTPFRLAAERSLRAQQNPAASRWTKKAVVAPGTGR